MPKNETLTQVNDWIIANWPFIAIATFFIVSCGFVQGWRDQLYRREQRVRAKKPTKRSRNPARPPVRGW